MARRDARREDDQRLQRKANKCEQRAGRLAAGSAH